jgi:hypothetical protein
MSETGKRWYPRHQYAHVRRTVRGGRGGKEKVEASKVEEEGRRRS